MLLRLVCKDDESSMFSICLNSFASSAYTYNSESILHASNKALIYIKNNKGPKLEPCGIPLMTSAPLEKLDRSLTLCFLFARKEVIQLI